MASLTTRQTIAVHGYIRTNFKKECMVKAIVEIITRFYQINAGSLYAFGVNNDGQMGIDQDETYIMKPTVCPPFDENNCVDIASSGNRSLAIDTFGNLYAFGMVSHSINISIHDLASRKCWTVPTLIKIKHRIISIAVGGKDLLVLTQFGHVLTLEYNKKLENFAAKYIESIKKHRIVQISAGAYHCAAISDDSKLFLWGSNVFDQIGIADEQNVFVQTPVIIKLMDEDEEAAPKQIECGSDHCLATSKAGLIFSWGIGTTRQRLLRTGALGHGTNENVWSPKVIEALRDKKIVYIATGEWHCLCIDEDANVYSWGYGVHSNLGHGVEGNGNEGVPRIIQYFVDNSIKVKWCSAGPCSSAIISDDDRLFSFGMNNMSCNHPQSHELAPFESPIINIPKERNIDAPVGKVVCSNLCIFFITEMKKLANKWLRPRAKNKETQMNDKRSIAVCGYIRMNFKRKCMVKDIIQIISDFYMVNAGNLYCFGSGSLGRLGIQKYDGKLHYGRKCKIPILCPPFNKNNCVQIAIHLNHSLAVDTFGHVYAFGLNPMKRQFSNRECTTPKIIKLPHQTIAVAVGAEHSMILTEFGNILTFGRNGHAQLGHGHHAPIYHPKFIQVLRNYRIIQISAGEFHSAAVSKIGILFIWGANDCGQCALHTRIGVDNIVNDVIMPTIVNLNGESAKYIQCGHDHNLVITATEHIMSFGRGGPSGHGSIDPDENVHSAKLIEALYDDQIIDIAAGWNHSLCINKTENVYSWGFGHYGKLGHGNEGNQIKPKVIEYFMMNGIKCKRCFAGGLHSGVISNQNEFYVFGNNNFGQLGTNDLRERCVPTKVNIKNDLFVGLAALGQMNTMIITGKRKR